MGPGYILDTSVVIYYLEGVLDLSGKTVVEKAIHQGAKISVISKIELLSWNPPAGANINRLQNFIDDSIAFALNEPVIDQTIHLRRNYRKIKLPDAIIAATALCFNLKLITRNVSDYTSIGGLPIIDPFNI